MKISFIKSASKIEDWIQDDVTEFCFIGRSNTGKSSLINALANAKVAHSSSKPGRTNVVNFFNCGKFRIIDLPGYGYAKASKSQIKFFDTLINDYILHRKNLFGVFQICDANVITEEDAKMSKFFNERFINHFIVLNKTDKMPLSKYQNNMPKVCKFLNVNFDKIILASAKKKTGINEINSKIKQALVSINQR